MSRSIEPVSELQAALEQKLTGFEELLGDIWLYIDWFWVTRSLTTAQKEMFADAVDASSYRMAVEDGREDEWQPIAIRWWQDDYSGPYPANRRNRW